MSDTPTIIDIRRGCTSASNAQADLNCPGRHNAQKGIPPRESDDADFGRMIHATLANGTDVAKVNALDAEQRDIFDACRELEKKLADQFFPGAKQIRVFREQRYWVKVPSGPRHTDPTKDQPVLFEHSGQPDVVYRSGPKALIIDYKTLPGDVAESNRNLQLRDLAVLVRGNLMVPEIGVAIVQPLVTMNPEICLYSKEELDQAEKEMFERVRVSNISTQRVPGEVQCKFCLAAPKCEVYQKWATSLVPSHPSILDVPMASWSGAQCAAFCAGRAAAQKWLNDASDMVKARLKANKDAIPGWTLKPGKNRTTVTKPEVLHARFLELGGTTEHFMKTIKVGNEKFEAQVRAVTKTKGKELRDKIDELLKGVSETKQDEQSLAKKD